MVIFMGSLELFLHPSGAGALPEALNRLRFSSVLLCLAVSLLRRSPGWLPLLWAAWGDSFLIFTPWYLPGICFFILAQEAFRRLLGLPFSYFLAGGSLALALFTAARFCFLLPLGVLEGAAAFYTGALLGNLAASWRAFAPAASRRPRGASCSACAAWRRRAKKAPGGRWPAVSLTLLFLCDIQVALRQLPFYLAGPLPSFWDAWIQLSPTLIWAFYLPAQALLASLSLGKSPWAAPPWAGSLPAPAPPQSPSYAPALRPPR